MFEERRSNLFLWVAAAVLIAAIGYRVIASRAPAPPPVQVAGPSADGGPKRGGGAQRVYVHVAGAVKRPGLYRVPQGARVAAAIELAGGTKRKADLTTINLAAKVEDGQQVVVPVRGLTPAVATTPPGPGQAAAGPISLATATQAQLEELDGIGPALAQAILEYRDANGGYRSVEQLQEVSGIGEVRFEALRQAVRP